jgi:SAM-dependent methyltransferase
VSTPPLPYDRVAAVYDATRGWPPEVAARIGAGLYALLAPAARPGAPRVVEVGAGSGRALAPLAARGAWAVGADVSTEMLRLLLEKRRALPAPAPLYAVRADAHHLPFPAAAFDAGLLVHILHLVGDWAAALEELIRVVRPGGPLLLGLDEGDPGAYRAIDARWQELIEEAGGAPRRNDRETVTAAAVAHLAARGYTAQEHILARWTETRPLAETVERLRARCFPSSWHLPDAVLEPAAARLTAELVARYGSLDHTLSRECWFRVVVTSDQ